MNVAIVKNSHKKIKKPIKEVTSLMPIKEPVGYDPIAIMEMPVMEDLPTEHAPEVKEELHENIIIESPSKEEAVANEEVYNLIEKAEKPKPKMNKKPDKKGKK